MTRSAAERSSMFIGAGFIGTPLRVIFLGFLGSLITVFPVLEAGAAEPPTQTGFPVTLNGEFVRTGSIALADLTGDDVPEIVVGGSDGKVHAYSGAGVELWVYDTGDMSIESKPAIGDLDNDGDVEVVVGAGSTFTIGVHGGLYILDHLGSLVCEFQVRDREPDGFREEVFSSPAIADLDRNDDGRMEIVFGANDFYVYMINDDCSLVWEDWVRDTIRSSPALADIDQDYDLEIIIGAASHEEASPYNTLDGGLLLAYEADGTRLSGFPIQIDEEIDSSPAVGLVDGDTNEDIAVGTGRCWSNPACAPGTVHPGVGEYLNLWDVSASYLTGWPVSISGHYSKSSPALADLDEDGSLEIIINTQDPDDSQGGLVYALNADGTSVPGWPVQPVTPKDTAGNTVSYQTGASPVVADIDGDGHLEVLLPSNFDIVVWDKDGNQLTRQAWPIPPEALIMKASYTISATVAVGDIDDDGDLEVVAATGNANPPTAGLILAWDLPGTASAASLPWPSFRQTADNWAWTSDRSSLEVIFEDGFESGNTSFWDRTVP